ncbi:hypothetical protein [Amycolatopsis sp. NPDC004079]|uniref:hypothetical protein n=1 Tax=Amycolatopsis sp. NPDC004079 TaxID=3154549 RepID=UPI0033AE2E00
MITRSDVTVVATGIGGMGSDVWHVRVGAADFLVSAVAYPWGNGSETAVFPAGPDGKAAGCRDIVSRVGYDHEAAIADLIRWMNEQD